GAGGGRRGVAGDAAQLLSGAEIARAQYLAAVRRPVAAGRRGCRDGPVAAIRDRSLERPGERARACRRGRCRRGFVCRASRHFVALLWSAGGARTTRDPGFTALS